MGRHPDEFGQIARDMTALQGGTPFRVDRDFVIDCMSALLSRNPFAYDDVAGQMKLDQMRGRVMHFIRTAKDPDTRRRIFECWKDDEGRWYVQRRAEMGLTEFESCYEWKSLVRTHTDLRVDGEGRVLEEMRKRSSKGQLVIVGEVDAVIPAF